LPTSTTKPWGATVARIELAIKQHGPMTRADLERHLGMTKDQFGGCLTRMTRDLPLAPQRIHVASYVYDQEGQRRYPRAVYAYGPGENKPKPKADTKKNRMLYYRRSLNRIRNASVFNLGLRRDDIRQMKKDVFSSSVHMGQGS
jgi:hypothetical protein